MKVHLASIGCRLNHSEIETMARELLAAGHEVVAEAAAADRVIVNTCAVTAGATRDARAMTRRIHRHNVGAEIVLTGCYATLAPDQLARLEGVSHVVSNKDKDRLIQIVDPSAPVKRPLYEQEPVLREFLNGHLSRTRSFVKVQDGCNNRCTFCVTTIARGEGRSRSQGDIVTEIQALAQAGYQEVVLTGVHLGSYGHDRGNRSGLRELVRVILEDTAIPRLRLSSLEPWDLSPDFFELWQNPRLLPHLHLPLQSGSDRILRRMARRTTRAGFRRLVDAARAAIPDVNLSTDIIVGFPGEREPDFERSLAFCQEMQFPRLHVFSYSRRPGTVAATMPDQVEPASKKERARRMIALGQNMSQQFHSRYVGHSLNVLWERPLGADSEGLRWVGYSDNYVRVTAHGPADLFNHITATTITEARADGAVGVIATG